MAKSVFQGTITSNTTGLPVPSAQITIRRESDNGLASLWQDRAGTLTQGNPATANSEGFFQVYLDPGRYKVTATGTGLSGTPLRDCLVFDEDLTTIVDIEEFILEAVADAQIYRNEAREYALNDEDEPVSGSPEEFSAKHWAIKAQENSQASLVESIDNATTAVSIDDNDAFAIVPPSSPVALWRVTLSLIKSTLKTYFDTLYSSVSYPEYNYLINPEFVISQRGGDGASNSFTSATTPANNDDTYLYDRWYLLSDGNDIVDVFHNESGHLNVTEINCNGYSIFDIETANKKFGIAQIISYRDCLELRGGVCSLSFYARKTGSSLTKIRAAVLVYTGNPDVTVPSDFISAWNVQGTNPTVASVSYANTPGALADLTTSFQRYTIENISISSSMTNLIVFIWCDNTTTTLSDQLQLTQVKLQPGPICTAFNNSKRHISQEIRLCQRYYQKSYNIGTRPGVATTVGAVSSRNSASTSSIRSMQSDFQTRMRITPPTITWYSTNDGSSGVIFNVSDTANRTVTSTSGTSDRSTGWPNTSASETDGDALEAQWTAEAEL